jgi:hypothetical protein
MKTKLYVLLEPRYSHELYGQVRYIGKTTYTPERRLIEHMSEARLGGTDYRCKWIRCCIKDGVEPKVQQILEVEGDGSNEEIQLIKTYKDSGCKLVNTTEGGEGHLGYKPSLETRMKIAESQKGKKLSPESIAKRTAKILGRKHTLDARMKMSQALKGKEFTPDHKAKLSSWQRGRKLSLATRQKMSERLKERWKDPSYRQKGLLQLAEACRNSATGRTLQLESISLGG